MRRRQVNKVCGYGFDLERLFSNKNVEATGVVKETDKMNVF